MKKHSYRHFLDNMAIYGYIYGHESKTMKLIQQVSTTILGQLGSLSVLILRLVQEQGRVTVAEVLTQTSAHRNTVKLHLKNLVRDQYLVKNGLGKGTFYLRK